MDFIVDGCRFAELQENLTYTAMEVSNRVAMIYTAIDEIHLGWAGDQFDKYFDEMLKFEGPLQDVALALYAFGNVLSGFSVAIKALQDSVNDALLLKATAGQETGIDGATVNAQFESSSENNVFTCGAVVASASDETASNVLNSLSSLDRKLFFVGPQREEFTSTINKFNKYINEEI